MSESRVRSLIFSIAWSLSGISGAGSPPRHEHVLGLATLPAAEIEAVGAAISELLVGIQAHVGMALLAIAADAARHVEGDRAEVAFLDAFDGRSHLDDLAGILVAELHSRWSREAPMIDVQVAAADVRR